MFQEPLLSVRKAAQRLRMSEYMVRHWARKGELRHERVDEGVAIIFRESEVERFAELIKGLTSNEVATILGMSLDAVRSCVTRGELPARKPLGQLRFDLADVQKFAEERGISLRVPEERGAA